MLKSTFLHIPCVGSTTEQYLWAQGMLSWDEFIRSNEGVRLSSNTRKQILHYLDFSMEQLEQKKHSFFSANLSPALHWRAYPEFSDRCCFLDIETTGLDKQRDEITVIGLYDGAESKFFINGINMEDFEKEIRNYSMIVSFNGRCFDVPFIENKFDLDLDLFHIDLRFMLSKLGYRGGLKRIEKVFGLARDDEVAEIDGFEAVRLWHRYKRGDKDALHTLIEYNRADIENLKSLMEQAFVLAKDSTGHLAKE